MSDVKRFMKMLLLACKVHDYFVLVLKHMCKLSTNHIATPMTPPYTSPTNTF